MTNSDKSQDQNNKWWSTPEQKPSPVEQKIDEPIERHVVDGKIVVEQVPLRQLEICDETPSKIFRTAATDEDVINALEDLESFLIDLANKDNWDLSKGRRRWLKKNPPIYDTAYSLAKKYGLL